MGKEPIVQAMGPLGGSVGQLIAKIIAVGAKYNKFVATPKFYRVCLGSCSAAMEELASYTGASCNDCEFWGYMNELLRMAGPCKSDCGVHIKRCTYSCVYPDVGVAISCGKWTFCLTLYTNKWHVEVIPPM